MKHHLAQINIAHCKGPLDSPVMRDFVELLDAMNALADNSSGFVWRWRTPAAGDPVAPVHPDPLVLPNLSVWTTVEALHQYAYRSSHAYVFRNRSKWFEELAGPHLALWWIEAGTTPTIAEGFRRLAILAESGPTSAAFTFKQPFPAPDA